MNEYIKQVVVTINKEESVMGGAVEEYMYQVMLFNNRSYAATSTDEQVFMVQLDSGVRAYPVSKIKSYAHVMGEDGESVVVNQDAHVDNNKEDQVLDIYHFLSEMREGDKREVGRFITTSLRGYEEAAYRQSLITHRPVLDMKGNMLLAMTSGDWEYITLKSRLADKGKNFRLMVMDHATLASLGTAAQYISKSTFAWANASAAFFLKVEGESEWGLSALGLDARNTKKISKRLQEVTRDSAHWLYDESGMKLSLRCFDPVMEDVKLYDGMNIIRRSLANKMGFKKSIHRINIRIMTKDGVIKGDAIIVPDHFIDSDVVYHFENLKNDLLTNGWMMVSGFEHHTNHFAVWDDQSMINNKNILREAHQMRDIDTLVANLRESLEAGTLPDWFMLGEDAHDEFGVPDMDKLSERLHLNYVRAQANGLDINSAQNLVYMATNGITIRMRSSIDREKMWLPMSNAFTGAVVTTEALMYMGNINIPVEKQNIVFFDKKWGLVIPGRRFIDTYNLHGGWDQDDTTKVVLIKLWSSDENVTAVHKAGRTVPAELDIPSNKEDAVMCVAFIRSPNGPGEVSFEIIDFDSMVETFHNLDMDKITTVDLAARLTALPQSVLADQIEISGIEGSLVYNQDESFNVGQASKMIQAQKINPGIGPMANITMFWVNTFGPCFPPKMAAFFEQMVDDVQQEADAVKFMAIDEERMSVFAQYLEHLSVNGGKIDSYLVTHRMKSIKMRDMLPKHLIEPGRLGRVYTKYTESIAQIEKDIRDKSFQRRQSCEFVQMIKRLPISADSRQWSMNFYAKYSRKMFNAGRDLKDNAEFMRLMGTDDKDGRQQARAFGNLILQDARSREVNAIVAEMVAEIEALDDLADRRVISLYNLIVTKEEKGTPYGLQDRLIFQPGAKGELCVMDLFIQALKNKNLL